MIDMRKRFRGNAPLSIGKDAEGGVKSQPVPQLYGGKPAFSTQETKIDESAMDIEQNPRGL